MLRHARGALRPSPRSEAYGACSALAALRAAAEPPIQGGERSLLETATGSHQVQAPNQRLQDEARDGYAAATLATKAAR
jgi:hypothetical protein